MGDMSNLLIDPEKFLCSVPRVLEGREWYAAAFAKLNRNGIPEPNGSGFEGVFDMDFICSHDLQGEELKRYRKPAGTIALPWEEAMTLYRIGEGAIVVNMSSGYHPDRKTIVLTKPLEKPDQRILDRFGEYYGKEPRLVKAFVNIEISLGW